MFEKYIKNSNKIKPQKGGSKVKLPILDNPLVGNYLKLIGISVLDLSMSTLLPLGIVMIIYDLTLKEQIGGDITNPFSYKLSLSGGGKYLLGSDIPTGYIQKLNSFISGDNMPEPLLHIFVKSPVVNDSLQLSCNNGLCNNTSTSFNLSNNNNISKNDTSLTSLSSLGINTRSSNNYSKVLPNYSTPESIHIPRTMAGGSNKTNIKNKSKKDLIDKQTINNLRKYSFNQKGKGSDWMSSQYSAGPANSKKMSDYQFRMFNKTDINNNDFAKHYQKVPTELLIDTPLYKQTQRAEGLSTSQFAGNLEPNELNNDRHVDYSITTKQFGGNLTKKNIYQILDKQYRTRENILKSLLKNHTGGSLDSNSIIRMSKDKRIKSENIYKFFPKKDLIKEL